MFFNRQEWLTLTPDSGWAMGNHWAFQISQSVRRRETMSFTRLIQLIPHQHPVRGNRAISKSHKNVFAVPTIVTSGTTVSQASISGFGQLLWVPSASFPIVCYGESRSLSVCMPETPQKGSRGQANVPITRPILSLTSQPKPSHPPRQHKAHYGPVGELVCGVVCQHVIWPTNPTVIGPQLIKINLNRFLCDVKMREL